MKTLCGHVRCTEKREIDKKKYYVQITEETNVLTKKPTGKVPMKRES
jgi:hypothetical protein